MNDSSISFVCLVLVVAASCAIVAFGENDESIVLGVAADLPQSICRTMQCSEGVPLPAEKGHRLIVGLLPTPHQQLHPNPSLYVKFAICVVFFLLLSIIQSLFLGHKLCKDA